MGGTAGGGDTYRGYRVVCRTCTPNAIAEPETSWTPARDTRDGVTGRSRVQLTAVKR